MNQIITKQIGDTHMNQDFANLDVKQRVSGVKSFIFKQKQLFTLSVSRFQKGETYMDKEKLTL